MSAGCRRTFDQLLGDKINSEQIFGYGNQFRLESIAF